MSQQGRLSLVLALNLLMIAGLILVGLTSHSLSVLASGGDYVADSFAIGLGIAAIHVSKHPHGHPKATTYVALINASMLLAVTVYVIIEAIRRLTTTVPQVAGLPVLIVSGIATIVMTTGALILGRDAGSEDLHMRSVLLDTLSDALASAAVAITGLLIYLNNGLSLLDPAVAILIGIVVGYGAVKLLRDVITDLRKRPAVVSRQP